MILNIDKLYRSNRKTLAIEINKGELIVRAPRHYTKHQIGEFLNEKAKWIVEKLNESRKKIASKPVKNYLDGDEILFLGDKHKLRLESKNGTALFFDENNFYLSPKYQEIAPNAFELWYKMNAKKIISRRVSHYSQITKLIPKNVKITSAKTNWGSCSGRNNLNFTWRLVMAPLDVIDYVVIHELVHIKHKDHSRNFWNKVAEYMPDFREKRNWLKEHGHLLDVE